MIVLVVTVFVLAAPADSGIDSSDYVNKCNYRPDVSLTLSDCCPNIYKYLGNDAIEEKCEKLCLNVKELKQLCCQNDCLLEEYSALTNGALDPVKTKAALVKESSWDPTLVSSIVDSCFENSSALLVEIQMLVAERSVLCTDAGGLNWMLRMCIHHQIYMKCPIMSTSTDCKLLFKFATECSLAFIPDQEVMHDSIEQNERHRKASGSR